MYSVATRYSNEQCKSAMASHASSCCLEYVLFSRGISTTTATSSTVATAAASATSTTYHPTTTTITNATVATIHLHPLPLFPPSVMDSTP